MLESLVFNVGKEYDTFYEYLVLKVKVSIPSEEVF